MTPTGISEDHEKKIILLAAKSSAQSMKVEDPKLNELTQQLNDN
jgi:hypothetical protein